VATKNYSIRNKCTLSLNFITSTHSAKANNSSAATAPFPSTHSLSPSKNGSNKSPSHYRGPTRPDTSLVNSKPARIRRPSPEPPPPTPSSSSLPGPPPPHRPPTPPRISLPPASATHPSPIFPSPPASPPPTPSSPSSWPPPLLIWGKPAPAMALLSNSSQSPPPTPSSTCPASPVPQRRRSLLPSASREAPPSSHSPVQSPTPPRSSPPSPSTARSQRSTVVAWPDRSGSGFRS